MRLRGLTTVVGAAALALTLAGCGDDEPATGTVGGGDGPPTTTEPTPEDDNNGDEGNGGDDNGGDGNGGGSDLPNLPDEELPEPEEGDAEAATAFLEDYLEATNEASQTGDYSRVAEMVAESCELCQESMDRISGYYSDGGSLDGGLIADPEIEVEANLGGMVALRAEVDVEAARVLDSDGNEVESFPEASDRVYLYGLEKGDQQQWRITSWEAAS